MSRNLQAKLFLFSITPHHIRKTQKDVHLAQIILAVAIGSNHYVFPKHLVSCQENLHISISFLKNFLVSLKNHLVFHWAVSTKLNLITLNPTTNSLIKVYPCHHPHVFKLSLMFFLFSFTFAFVFLLRFSAHLLFSPACWLLAVDHLTCHDI
jgi:hypothetical protein